MTDARYAERIAHGEAADHAVKTFLGPAFDAVIADWTTRMSDIAAKQPWETDKIKNLAMAVRAATEAKSQIMAVVFDGEAALIEQRQRRRIEDMSPERRKLAGIF